MSISIKNALEIVRRAKKENKSYSEVQREMGLKTFYIHNVKSDIKKGVVKCTEEEKAEIFGIKNEAIEQFSNDKGIDIENVSHFWYKGKHINGDSISAFIKNQETQNIVSFLNDNLLSSIKTLNVPNLPKITQKNDKKGVYLELNMYDCHFGKQDFLTEQGTKETLQRFKESITHFVDFTLHNYKVERIYLSVGNDLFNVDNKALTTTKGTPQDNDLSFEKMFLTVQKLIIETISFLATISDVDCIMVRGNHDYMSVFMLGQVLEAYFHNNDSVKIENCLGRTARLIGNTCVGFAHGENDIKKSPAIIFKEFPEISYRAKFHEWHCGHWHTQKTVIDEKIGIVTRYFSSLSVNDRWHYQEGYVGNRISASALIHSLNDGVISTQTICF